MANPTVQPTSDGLRIREEPVNGKPIGQVGPNDILESLESHAETLRKLNQPGEWLKIRSIRGGLTVEGYVAAWMLAAIDVKITPEPPKSAPPVKPPQPPAELRPIAPPPSPPAPDTSNEPLYVRPTTDGLRVREAPVSGTPIGQVSSHHVLEVLEPAAAARAKIGHMEQWIKIRKPDGDTAYIAAWYVEETVSPVAMRKARLKNIRNILGMNLDYMHGLGAPTPDRLGELGWVRFGYNVSMGTGSQDLTRAYNTYSALAERYTSAGFNVMFTLTHQTYGEGINEFWPWPSMTDDRWQRLTARFAEFAGKIAQQFAGKGIVHCWQIWNEQDAPIGAAASVPMSAQNYARLLTQTVRAIREYDPTVLIITGGHTGGPGPGVEYARATVRSLPADVRLDGIAFHPYGRGPRPGTRYANWGHLEDEVAAYAKILPDAPLWITEWGVLDKEGDPAADVAAYAAEFIDYLNAKYAGRIAAAVWYAWAMGMHNGYGLIARDGHPIEPLYTRFLRLRG
jgi:hypothetical protein